VFTWRRQVRDGVLVAPDMPVFMPVRMLERSEATTTGLSRPEPHPAPASAPSRPQSGLIEIELGNGSQVRVGSDVNLAALRRVLTALRG
jgi:transposase